MRIILHLDMNSYFASVEQQANPFFRNKPVGVCAYLSNNGCIIASSIEAKKVGIKTGCRVFEAKKLYPGVILIENDPDKYRTVTRKFFNILTSYSSDFEPYSIDEGFLDLTGYVKDFNQAGEIADNIRLRIKQEIGEWIKCSMGLSFTKFLAKFASDVTGVDSLLVIEDRAQLDKLFSNRSLTDVWGINFRLASRLNNLGIKTILDLKNYPLENLILALGKYGYFLWARVNGLEVDNLKGQEELLPKSIGHSYCVPNRTKDKKYLLMILAKLCHKVGRRLRERGQVAYGIYIHWSYVSGGGFGRQFKLKKSVRSTDEIYQKSSLVIRQTDLIDKVMMLAVGVFNLTYPSNQLELFVQESSGLIEALDEISNRYGSQVIYRGAMWKTDNLAKDRIGFRKIDAVDYSP